MLLPKTELASLSCHLGAYPVVKWVKNPPAMQEMKERWTGSLGRGDSQEEGGATRYSPGILAWRMPQTQVPGGLQSIRRKVGQPTPVFLPGECHRQRRLVGSSPRSQKESDTTETTAHDVCSCHLSFQSFFGYCTWGEFHFFLGGSNMP